MNLHFRTSLLSLSVLGLAACASMHNKPDSASVDPQRSPSAIDTDEAYVAAVERVARRRGLEVVWVNMPRKPAGRDQ